MEPNDDDDGDDDNDGEDDVRSQNLMQLTMRFNHEHGWKLK